VAAKLPETAPFPAFPGGFKYTPIEQLRNLFVGFTQGLFDAAPSGCYHWDLDDAISEIIIRDEAPVKEEVIAKRPLITFTRGPIQFYSLGLDDMMKYQFDTGQKTKSVLVPGTMTMNCCSRVPQEAENISWVVMEHLCYFLPKQTHPLDPARTVHVRTVRPYCQGLRPYLAHGSGQVPIPLPCVEESQT